MPETVCDDRHHQLKVDARESGLSGLGRPVFRSCSLTRAGRRHSQPDARHHVVNSANIVVAYQTNRHVPHEDLGCVRRQGRASSAAEAVRFTDPLSSIIPLGSLGHGLVHQPILVTLERSIHLVLGQAVVHRAFTQRLGACRQGPNQLVSLEI